MLFRSYIRTNATREKIKREFGTVLFAAEAGAGELDAAEVGAGELDAAEAGVGESDAAGADAATTEKETAFITNVISGKKVEDLLSRGITALTKFRILGDY